MANVKRIIVDGVEYDSCKAAADYLNVHVNTISSWLKSGRAEFQNHNSKSQVENHSSKITVGENHSSKITVETIENGHEKIWFDDDLGVDSTMWQSQPERKVVVEKNQIGKIYPPEPKDTFQEDPVVEFLKETMGREKYRELLKSFKDSSEYRAYKEKMRVENNL
ncbi:MAG: hypothetical protein ABIK96_00795 [bacterium]